MDFNQVFYDLLYAALYGVIIWAVRLFAVTAIPYIKTKLASDQYSWASVIIDNAVRAFEQTVSGSGQGAYKYSLVLEYVTSELNMLGIKLTESQISTLIEAAVQEMNQFKLEESVGLIGGEDETIQNGVEDESA